MASSPATPLQASAEEKLALLKKVYRTLKQEMERREESHATERATWQRERATLLSRGDQLKRELSTLKASVRTAAAEAFVNGVSVGRQNVSTLGFADFGPVPFRPGNLTAVAYDRGGAVVARARRHVHTVFGGFFTL